MTAVVAWARDLVALALFGYLLELLLPSHSMEGYVRLVVGLVILAALVSPLFSWLRPGRTVRLELPGADATGVRAVLNDEQRYAGGESAQILALFAAQAQIEAGRALRRLPEIVAAKVQVHVVPDPASPRYGQIDGVAVAVRARAGAEVSPSLARRAVASTLGIAPGLVTVHMLPQGTADPAP